ncbi:hypothetical protein [Devosia sp. FJ2-5-3]|uniref:hypothetical protein n=1 Tax=Devosia sp. FJ2-5-3 TaxID=2976680 RepID=UPI0023D80B15|nr:hypothetical protein [Devosia sp. FJ2-5-3]WEJ60188.1 hypothetical protein N0P34_09200 [Devosia sp. FJ2-5-3]
MNPSKEEIAALVERVRGLKGADREVDVLIWLATTEGATRKATTVSSALGLWDPYVIDETRDASGRLIDAPQFTASVDAALALLERVQPGWGVETTTPAGGGKASCRIYPGSSLAANASRTAFGSASTIQNAILLALLLSLQSQEPTNGL